MSEFSDRLRYLREKRGFSVGTMRDRAGLLDRQYRRYENGEQEPTLSKAAALAKALDVSLDYLAGLTEEEK